jgi:hypothetical protein
VDRNRKSLSRMVALVQSSASSDESVVLVVSGPNISREVVKQALRNA